MTIIDFVICVTSMLTGLFVGAFVTYIEHRKEKK